MNIECNIYNMINERIQWYFILYNVPTTEHGQKWILQLPGQSTLTHYFVQQKFFIANYRFRLFKNSKLTWHRWTTNTNCWGYLICIPPTQAGLEKCFFNLYMVSAVKLDSLFATPKFSIQSWQKLSFFNKSKCGILPKWNYVKYMLVTVK